MLRKDGFRDTVSRLVDTPVLAVAPAGQGAQDIIQGVQVPGGEVVLLHEPDRVLYRPFAFRIRFVADPQLQFLFGAEIFEYPGLDDLAVCLISYEDGIRDVVR